VQRLASHANKIQVLESPREKRYQKESGCEKEEINGSLSQVSNVAPEIL
jgi:hypothetical protein